MSQAAELRFVQLGALALRLNQMEPQAILDELKFRHRQAPELLSRARLVLDVSRLDQGEHCLVELEALSRLLAEEGFALAGLVSGGAARELAERIHLPLMGSASDLKIAAASGQLDSQQQPPQTQPELPPPPEIRAARHIERPIRSGQQIYARDNDLVIAGSVSEGAEVIADGSIHVYGSLRGRALAGASGDEQARVYSLDFEAQLVSVAGHYKVFEELPAELRGARVQAWLESGQLRLGKLS